MIHISKLARKKQLIKQRKALLEEQDYFLVSLKFEAFYKKSKQIEYDKQQLVQITKELEDIENELKAISGGK